MPIPSSSLPYLPHSSRVSGTHSWIGWRWAVRCAIGGIELPSVSASSFQCFITPRLSASSVESHKDLQTHYRQISLVPSHSFPLSGISPQLQKGRSFTNVFSASTHTLSLIHSEKAQRLHYVLPNGFCQASAGWYFHSLWDRRSTKLLPNCSHPPSHV